MKPLDVRLGCMCKGACEVMRIFLVECMKKYNAS